jgi:hypothetical protein
MNDKITWVKKIQRLFFPKFGSTEKDSKKVYFDKFLLLLFCNFAKQRIGSN